MLHWLPSNAPPRDQQSHQHWLLLFPRRPFNALSLFYTPPHRLPAGQPVSQVKVIPKVPAAGSTRSITFTSGTLIKHIRKVKLAKRSSLWQAECISDTITITVAVAIADADAIPEPSILKQMATIQTFRYLVNTGFYLKIAQHTRTLHLLKPKTAGFSLSLLLSTIGYNSAFQAIETNELR